MGMFSAETRLTWYGIIITEMPTMFLDISYMATNLNLVGNHPTKCCSLLLHS